MHIHRPIALAPSSLLPTLGPVARWHSTTPTPYFSAMTVSSGPLSAATGPLGEAAGRAEVQAG